MRPNTLVIGKGIVMKRKQRTRRRAMPSLVKRSNRTRKKYGSGSLFAKARRSAYTSKHGSGTVVLKTRRAAVAYISKHVSPIAFGPKGQPIYAYEELEKLDIVYPDQRR